MLWILLFSGELLFGLPLIVNGLAFYELPNILRKASVFLLDLEEEFGIINARYDFEPISNDLFTCQKGGNFCIIESCHFFWIEVGICSSVSFSSFQDCQPAKTCLGAFQDEEFKMFLIIVNRDTPFGIMVSFIELIAKLEPKDSDELQWNYYLSRALNKGIMRRC